jgi:hypothetical protein
MRLKRVTSIGGRLRTSVFVVLAAAALAIPVQALAGPDLPFKGSDSGMWGMGSHDCGALFPVFVETAGHATQLGRYAYSSQECVNFGDATYAGAWAMVGASGDRIQGTYAGSFTLDGSTIVYEQENTITGGTGRFTGASGSFHLSGLAFADGSGLQALSGSISK